MFQGELVQLLTALSIQVEQSILVKHTLGCSLSHRRPKRLHRCCPAFLSLLDSALSLHADESYVFASYSNKHGKGTLASYSNKHGKGILASYSNKHPLAHVHQSPGTCHAAAQHTHYCRRSLRTDATCVFAIAVTNKLTHMPSRSTNLLMQTSIPRYGCHDAARHTCDRGRAAHK